MKSEQNSYCACVLTLYISQSNRPVACSSFDINAFEQHLITIRRLQAIALTVQAQGFFTLKPERPSTGQTGHLGLQVPEVDRGAFAGCTFCQVSPVISDGFFAFLRKGSDQKIDVYNPFGRRTLQGSV
jgi:hypothetical protein